MKRVLYLLILLLMSGVSHAQIDSSARTNIQGNILTTDGQPAPFVSITLKGSRIGTTTDGEGKFFLKDIKPGSYTLQASGVGFETLRENITVVGEQVTQVSYRIATAVKQLQTVEVTGRKETTYKNDYSFALKTQVPVKDIPQAISTVTKELILDQQSYRLQDVTKSVAGVNQFSVYDDITIRGFRSSDNRLLNGLRWAGNFWTSPLLVNIERVEFIKGPASAMFGNANPGGTINMVTKKPLDETRANVQLSLGSFKTTRATADFTGPLNEQKTLLYRLNLGYENSGSFRDYVDFKTLVVAPSISFVPNAKTRINFDLTVQDINTVLDRGRTVFRGEQNLLATPINFNLTQPGDRLNPKIFSAALSWSQNLSRGLNLNVAYMRFREDQTLTEHRFQRYITRDSIQLSYTDRIVNYVNDNANIYLTWQTRTSGVEHLLLGGYDYAGYDYNFSEKFANSAFNINLNQPTFQPRDVAKYVYSFRSLADNRQAYSSHGVYVQDQIKWNRWQLLLSLRREQFTVPTTAAVARSFGRDIQTTALLPRFGLVYALTPSTNFYATYNQGFQVIAPGSAAFLDANPPKPITSRLLEVGAKSEWFDKRLLTTLSLYNLEQDNVVVNANNPARPDQVTQRGQERARGAEFEVVGNLLPNLSVLLGYAYNEAIISRDNNERLVGLTKENAPRHASTSWIKYTLTGKLNGLGFALGHSHNSVRNGFRDAQLVSVILPGYVVFNAMAYYQIQQVRLSVNANNLTNKAHFTGGYNFERNFPGAPRNYLTSIAYTF
ncbi:TonB-dependent siderophore receptor [Spirosoma arcticum]